MGIDVAIFFFRNEILFQIVLVLLSAAVGPHLNLYYFNIIFIFWGLYGNLIPKHTYILFFLKLITFLFVITGNCFLFGETKESSKFIN